MTKLEQVARAMFAAHNANRPHAQGLTWDDNSVDWERAEYLAMARAAIETLREPTSEMINKGYDHVEEGLGADTEKVWKAMIDAILNEKTE